ncbi:MAG: hypothetical protein K9M15_02760 [Candidatus Marinimicrobia bacterium]|nr:hypothetical protein [Candidatus Neomarinimicrobiota bacterium]
MQELIKKQMNRIAEILEEDAIQNQQTAEEMEREAGEYIDNDIKREKEERLLEEEDNTCPQCGELEGEGACPACRAD